MSDDFLRVRRLCKSYPSGRRRLQVLSELELDLGRGRMLAVTGPSGCGKSTLLHLIGAMDQPDSGQILFEGRDVSRLDRDQRAEFRNREIGFVFQFHHLLPEFSAVENVMMPLLLRRASRKAAAGRAEQLLERIGLADRQDHRPGELSGGEQQRVAVARALAGRPRLLLADEPTGNLDEASSREVQQLLVEIQRGRDLTCIVVTHNPALAALCESRLKMEAGKLVAG